MVKVEKQEKVDVQRESTSISAIRVGYGREKQGDGGRKKNASRFFSFFRWLERKKFNFSVTIVGNAADEKEEKKRKKVVPQSLSFPSPS